MSKVDTIKLQGDIEYAKVPARLKEYRQKNPKSDVQSTPHWHEDGSLDFETQIIRDKSDETSMSSNGWAHASATEMNKPKAFEKLETISIGRALAKQGYLNNGEIATTEEMEEFEDYRESLVMEAIEAVQTATTREELMEIQSSLPASQQLQLNEPIRARVKELQHATAK